jgi:hypothetical protein
MEENAPLTNTATMPIPIPARRRSESGSFGSNLSSQSRSRSRSNSISSKAMIEIEKIKFQREKRRQKQAEMKQLKEEMNAQEKEQFIFRQEIDKFRVKFAKNAAELRIRTNKTELIPNTAKINVCIRKRPISNKGITSLTN